MGSRDKHRRLWGGGSDQDEYSQLSCMDFKEVPCRDCGRMMVGGTLYTLWAVGSSNMIAGSKL